MEIGVRSALLALTLLASSLVSAHAHAGVTTSLPHPNLLPSCGEGGDPSPPINEVVRMRPAMTLGRTPSEIDGNFAGVIESNFTHGSASLVLSRLTDKELVGIARLYRQTNAGRPPKLLDVLASRLTAKELVRVAGVFGVNDVNAAVQRSASHSVASMYAARVATGEVTIPTTIMPMSGPAPTRYMTLEEIYLEFRTAPVGSLGPAAAFSETVIYAGGQVAAAGAVGWKIGTEVGDLIQEYDPSLWDAIGGTVAGVADRIQSAADAVTNSSGVQRGIQEHNADGMFQYPVSSSSDPYGDWDATWDLGNDIGDGCFD